MRRRQRAKRWDRRGKMGRVFGSLVVSCDSPLVLRVCILLAFIPFRFKNVLLPSCCSFLVRPCTLRPKLSIVPSPWMPCNLHSRTRQNALRIIIALAPASCTTSRTGSQTPQRNRILITAHILIAIIFASHISAMASAWSESAVLRCWCYHGSGFEVAIASPSPGSHGVSRWDG